MLTGNLLERGQASAGAASVYVQGCHPSLRWPPRHQHSRGQASLAREHEHCGVKSVISRDQKVGVWKHVGAKFLFDTEMYLSIIHSLQSIARRALEKGLK